jgi:hypothetical protein
LRRKLQEEEEEEDEDDNDDDDFTSETCCGSPWRLAHFSIAETQRQDKEGGGG